MHEIRLHVTRQAHREAIDVDLARVEAFGLKENLVPLLVGKSDDFVLERRTIARADAANLAVEQRRAIEVGAHQIANPIVCMEEIACNLGPLDAPSQERKWHGRIVAAFQAELAACDVAIEVDAV